MSIGVLERQTTQQARLGIVDCDIHPAMKGPGDIHPYLSERWREHLKTFGSYLRQPFASGLSYPRYGQANRLDATPPGGGFGGSDLAFMREQHLDPNNIDFGILQPMNPNGTGQRNQEFGAALCAATNDWQLEAWCTPEPRLKASLVVPQEDPAAAVKEIERHAGDRRFAQLSISPRGIEPHGRQRYWPLYEAAEAHRLPIGIHVGGVGATATTGSGWPSYYIEDHHSTSEAMQSLVVSLVVEGVFERFPGLKFVLIEGGFVWVPALGWRLDKHWKRLKAEVPHLRRLPSEVIREHFYYTTQPIDEPEHPADLREAMDGVGWERILFSTDYPHWDYDDPKYAFRIRLSEPERRQIFRDNAMALYRFGEA